ncbi:MAG TPA: NAD(P)-binding domain-containing protein [Rhodococcus sp. (in: high G+C Gram-positive bacteria)]|nr:NAD(P)-binding domain-containing protein [Rhodococcus sp. (in: high G+C Gram-positive bacteria)]
MPVTTTALTVIGLGPMGQAMTRILLAAGHPVTVWNRTPARADALVETGATRASEPAAAVAASELIILSLTDYQAMYDILDPIEDLTGRTIVNLSSDTPERTASAAYWVAGRGGHFVACGVMVPAPMLGTDAAYAYYSGDPDAFRRWEPVLRVLGSTRFLGADVRLAQLFYLANLDVFLTTLASMLHAAALIQSVGGPVENALADLYEHVQLIPSIIGPSAELAADLVGGSHPGELSTVTMMGATADHIVQASVESGVGRGLPDAVKNLYDAATAAGHGRDNWTSLFEVIKAERRRHVTVSTGL